VVRLGGALTCVIAAGVCLLREPVGILFALPLTAIAAVLALPELLRPFVWVGDALFGTGQSGQRPPLDLRLARHYLKEERWQEAWAEYERIQSYHPKVSEPYEEMMKLCPRLGFSEKEIERIHRKGTRRVRDRQARAELDRARGEARAALAGSE